MNIIKNMPPTRFSHRLVLLFVLTSTWQGNAHAQPTAESGEVSPSTIRTLFSNSFIFVGGAKERTALDEAIERSLDGMIFIAKPIARPKLRKASRILPSFSFEFPEGWIRSLTPGNPVAMSRDSGEVARFTSGDGEQLRLSQRFLGLKLVQDFSSSEGTRRNEYSISPNGSTMGLTVTITSSKLPQPLVYKLTYQKKPLQQRSLNQTQVAGGRHESPTI